MARTLAWVLAAVTALVSGRSPTVAAELSRTQVTLDKEVGARDHLPPLRVSDNHRFLVTESGQPFFWLGDTSWHLFGKSAREQTTNQPAVSLYFSNRAAKGFTIIQSVIVRWPEGGSSANAYGFEPFENGDWSRPRLRPGPNDDYWDHVDWCVAEAKRNRLYLAALPCWLDAIEDNNSMVRDPRVAYRYGHFLGARYGKEPHLIWVLGGDAYQKGRNVDQPARLALIRAQAEGIADAVNGVDQFDGQADWRTTLMTFHPPGGNHSSSEWLHAEPWLDFNMVQTTTRFAFENWRTVAKDYALQPPKPTFDAEVAYEGSLSLRQTEPQDRRIRPWEVRRAAYWNVFAGGLGHTYGHRSFIGWIRQGETYRFGAHIPWYESLDAPGAVQMGHLRRLMESRPFLARVPDQSVIAGETLAGDEHLQATRDADEAYAMVYSPSGRSFKVRLDKIAGPKVKAWWFSPRTGEAHAVGEFANTGEREFTPPSSGEDNDWVLVLDEASGDAAERSWPNPDWPPTNPAEVGLAETKLAEARDYALTGGGSGCILRHGKQVLAWGDSTQLYDLKSTTKSFGATVLGVALMDGKAKLDDPAKEFCPDLGVSQDTNAQDGWLDKITLRMLATQTAGFEKPGGFGKLLFEPGTKWHYSDGGPNWLADCLTLIYRRDLNEFMFERVFGPIGIGREDLRWRDNSYRPRQLDGIPRREFGAGISANIEAMARFGYLYLREGRWKDRELLPRSFVELARRTSPDVARLPVLEPPGAAERFGSASAHYGLLWWNNHDGTLPDVPRDAFWTWGLYDSLIVVVPSLDIVVARAGRSWPRQKNAGHYDVLKPFLDPICAAVVAEPRLQAGTFPVPTSPVIREIQWAPSSTILRQARGSDNWPMTWADDDVLYTAYGDGNGFEPFTPEKSSMGLARVQGGPTDFKGANLRSPTGEAHGDGINGKKASGLLCVDGALYLLARNAGNAQLAWSSDHGATWTWADWKFTTSFGCPTFLNFGKNYAGARDELVYIFSLDSNSAYEAADRMILARVPKNRIRDREAYEFLVRLDPQDQPVWAKDIAQRGAVFTNPGRCYRSGVTYNAALKRYLWVQILPQSRHPQGPRFQGGFGVFDAPEPWGPWTTVFFTEDWDVGPGETASLPTKWMSADGRTVHLVFSGDDHFSVRRGMLVMRTPTNPLSQ